MVAVKVRGKSHADNMEYKTRALLDSGSNRSFCTEQLLQTLGLEGQPVKSGEDDCLTTETDLEIVGTGMRWSQTLTSHKVIVKRTFPDAWSTAMATAKT